LPGQDWLYEANQWLILAISLGMLLAVTEIGFRRGRRRDGSANATVTQITTLQAAAFGILALLIGFTFAMALSRFEERRAVVLAEANAIGTVGLRAQLLPQPQADDAIPLLRRYVDLRLRLVEANLNPDELRLVVSQSLELQAVTAIEADPRPAVSGLFTQALNEMIDLHAKRLAALTNHVPDTVFVLLYMVAAIALGFTGYGCGLGPYPQPCCDHRHGAFGSIDDYSHSGYRPPASWLDPRQSAAARRRASRARQASLDQPAAHPKGRS